MRVTYQATHYAPERVTGRYVIYRGVKRGFTVYETASDSRGRPGMGPTIREYDTPGAFLPTEFAARLRAERTTLKWD